MRPAATIEPSSSWSLHEIVPSDWANTHVHVEPGWMPLIGDDLPQDVAISGSRKYRCVGYFPCGTATAAIVPAEEPTLSVAR